MQILAQTCSKLVLDYIILYVSESFYLILFELVVLVFIKLCFLVGLDEELIIVTIFLLFLVLYYHADF